MPEFYYEKIIDAFSSMKTADSISLDDIKKLHMLKEYYVDPFNYVNNIIQDEDNFIIGRRGTGKSTLIYRAYLECLNTWSETGAIYRKRILPLFIDLSQCTSIMCSENDDISFEEYFTSELIRNFKKYIYKFWMNIVPCDGNHEESTILDQIDTQLQDIEKLIITGRPIIVYSRTKYYAEILSKGQRKIRNF